MIRISVQSNIDQVVRGLSDAAREQIPFATAKALTETAKGIQAELKKSILSTFDRPTPWIQRSPIITPATKSNLEATVGINDKGSRATPAAYLKEHFSSGPRSNKPMEKAMRSAGILPAGWLALPSSDGVKKDAYGNVSKATVARILGELRGGGRRQEKGATYRLFIVRPGQADHRTRHLAPGIWSVARVGQQSILKPVFFFVAQATYRKVLDLPRIANDIVRKDFDRNFAAAFEQAMRTAR